jgi:signal transduction histidine kinase
VLQPLFDWTLESGIRNDSTRALDDFLAMISHELRIPISAILGWAELLDNQHVSHTDFATAIQVIRRNALVQVQLIESLTDYASVGVNKFALSIRAVSLAQIVKAAVEALTPMAREKQIHVDIQFGISPAEMEGDPTRLLQVFLNLLSNAIKFTPSGGSVRLGLESSGDCHTTSVSDTGEGITAEFLPFVFDRYRQADRTASRRGGLGLGLTIARHIVELHGGTIKAESAGKGKGSVFIIELPRTASSQTIRS